MPKTVLVVEDQYLVGQDVAEGLERRGWTVLGLATTVQVALQLLRIEKPNVAVLDMHLADGLVTPVAQQLLDLGMPFVVASAFPDLVAVGGKLFSDVLHVTKPYDVEELHKAILSAIGVI